MKPSKSQPKRRPTQARPGAESLERREVLTGGAGNTIALIPATISKPNVPTTVDVKVDATLFQMSKKGNITLGIDVAKQTDSSVTPKIKSISIIQGETAQSLGKVAGAKAKNVQFTRQGGSTAALVPLTWEKGRTSKSVIVRATIVGDKGTTGGLLAGYYLPGDANGDGKVDRSDIKLIKKQVGLNASNSNYQFDSDGNRDGKIDSKDVAIAQGNLGAATVVSPS
ncbi:MAG: dockerin type I domain-containing protein [Isosphaeraceae bacterium]